MEDIPADCKILLLSIETPEKASFKGLIDVRGVQGIKERRYDNALEVKKRINSINKDWTDKQYS